MCRSRVLVTAISRRGDDRRISSDIALAGASSSPRFSPTNGRITRDGSRARDTYIQGVPGTLDQTLTFIFLEMETNGKDLINVGRKTNRYRVTLISTCEHSFENT